MAEKSKVARVAKEVTCAVALVTLCVELCACSVRSVIDSIRDDSSYPSASQARIDDANTLEPQVSVPTIKENGYLTVGIKADTGVPFSQTDSQSRYWGLDIDLASALASELGLHVRFVGVSDATAVQKSCDVVMNVEDGEAEGVAQTAVYAQQSISLFGRGKQGSLTQEELVGRTIGARDAIAVQTTLSQLFPTASIEVFGNMQDCMEALALGKVDYVAADSATGNYFAEQTGDISQIGTIDDPVDIGCGIVDSNADLAQALQTSLDDLKASGKYQLIRNRWLNSTEEADEEKPAVQ